MKSVFSFFVALAAVAFLAVPASALDLDLGLSVGLGAGGVTGGSIDSATSIGGAASFEAGSRTISEAKMEGVAISESSFRGKFSNEADNGNVSTSHELSGKLQTQTGALAATSVISKGNGIGLAAAHNTSVAGGATGGIGGSGAAGLNIGY